MPVLRKCTPLSPTCLRWLRIGVFTVLGIVGVLVSLLLLHQGLFPIIAWLLPQSHNFFYDLAVFGAYPTATYVSFDHPAPDPIIARWDDRCDNGLVFFAPYDKSVSAPGPVIFDSRGEMVWMSDELGDVVTNFRVQRYHDQDYLTLWAGKKGGAQGKGTAYLLDSKYNIVQRIQPVGEGMRADLHEFQLTDDGTALITIFNTTTVDLRPMGWFSPKDGWIEDCIFQEIDLATGELVFQWRAQDYFKAENSYYWHPFAGYVESMPFDFYHINSVVKDSKGNFLVSSRHFHHVIYIDGKSGDVLWILGGHRKSNHFKDLSHGVATGFQWQHHARWLSEENQTLTLLDNGIAGPLHVDAPYSKGLLIQLDTNKYTAKVLTQYVSLTQAKAASQGSVQQLPNGNMFIGWGATAAWSEFTFDGDLLCESHFAAAWSFYWERAKSYRVFKFHNWTSTPDYPPSAKVQDGRVYVSWNGATEVRFWELQGSHSHRHHRGDESEEEDFEVVTLMEKQHFEDSFAIPPTSDFTRFRVVALDAGMQRLRHSDAIAAVPEDPTSSESEQQPHIFASICAATAAVVISAICLLRLCFRRREGKWVRWRPDASAVASGWFGREYRYSKL